jgi:hypothetical protein
VWCVRAFLAQASSATVAFQVSKERIANKAAWPDGGGKCLARASQAASVGRFTLAQVVASFPQLFSATARGRK